MFFSHFPETVCFIGLNSTNSPKPWPWVSQVDINPRDRLASQAPTDYSLGSYIHYLTLENQNKSSPLPASTWSDQLHLLLEGSTSKYSDFLVSFRLIYLFHFSFYSLQRFVVLFVSFCRILPFIVDTISNFKSSRRPQIFNRPIV